MISLVHYVCSVVLLLALIQPPSMFRGMGGRGGDIAEAMDIAKKVLVGITVFDSIVTIIGVIIGLVVGVVIDYQLFSILGID
jgi:hypothetical protein